jgi:hypothetical protein
MKSLFKSVGWVVHEMQFERHLFWLVHQKHLEAVQVALEV